MSAQGPSSECPKFELPSKHTGWVHRTDGKDPRVSGQAPTLFITVRVIFFLLEVYFLG